MTHNHPDSPYTPDQLTTYFNHISLSLSSPLPPPSLHLLSLLITHHLARVPFENTKLHYSSHPRTPVPPYTHNRVPPLDPESLYVNFVQKGRGGYCVEQNAFFASVLRGLGFEVRQRGGRVNRRLTGDGASGWSGWSHMVNLVGLPVSGDGDERSVGDEGEKEWWLVDVGFGAEGLLEPIRVDYDEESGAPHMVGGIGEMECRVRKFGVGVEENDQEQEGVDQKEELRVYETRVKGRKEGRWLPAYSFTRYLDFQSSDYEIMNWYVATHPKSWFTQRLGCALFLREGHKLVGTVTLDGEAFERRVGGSKENLRICKTEAERVEGLKKWFRMYFSDDEVEGIGEPAAIISENVS
ncbi:cysteine proteinase [Viridothelium virens]|uniref:Cysteine proteinase n=1 Tax=Viridothelium virens TaxID=1048519 RepID=A0A6A6HIG5_VIRVR|nr:cysteine proteinase [Viridothelium virens]